MPSCNSQFEYMYMIYTYPINHRVLSFEKSTVSFACIYKLFYDCKRDNAYYRKGTHGKEREGARHQYQ